MATAPKQKYDEVLMGLAQAHGNIESLLNTFFGFLHRNTDFYIEMKPPQQQMGFPPGTAEAMVRLRETRRVRLLTLFTIGSKSLP